MRDGNIRLFAATETHTFGASDLFGFLVHFPVFIVNLGIKKIVQSLNNFMTKYFALI